MSKPVVILLHGFMSNHLSMKYLENKISPEGYQVYRFSYNSPKYSHDTLAKLHTLIDSVQSDSIYLVGHSMGGLIIRNYLNTYRDVHHKIKGVITIATPHNGSKCAENMAQSVFKPFFGTAGASGLTKPIASWNLDIPIGCIAGISTSVWTANWFFWKLRTFAPNDGTVFLKEALLKNCTDKLILPGAHTALIMNKEVARQCCYFLKNSRFEHLN